MSDMARLFRIVDLNYITLYLHQHAEAIAFYSAVFGAPDTADESTGTYGWRMGSTWLTVFPASGGPARGENPRNTEFAIQVAAPEEADSLYNALVAAGAKPCMSPRDTSMYEPMRFACVDDPFGVRIDVYCPKRA